MHKQYNLRGRKIDVPETNKKTVPNEAKKGKTIPTPLQILPRSNTNPPDPIIEDVSDNQPNNEKPSTPLLSKETMEEPSKVDLGKSTNHHSNPEKKKDIENRTAQNPRAQIEKSFNLEAEVSKLKIFVLLSELAKHDVYQTQINRSLKIIGTEDSVNLYDDQPELVFVP